MKNLSLILQQFCTFYISLFLILIYEGLHFSLLINKMESKIRQMQEINKEIADAKNYINVNQGQIATKMNRYSTPVKPHAPTQNNTAETVNQSPETNVISENANESSQNSQQIANYIKNLKRLCTSLEQKNYALEVDYQKNILNYQFKLDQYKKETSSLKTQLESITAQHEEAEKKVKQIQKIIKQKQQVIKSLNQELSKNRTENVQLKLENKTYKADNKVIMSHLDRLNEKKNLGDNKSSLQERQLRVMKSIYQGQSANHQHTQGMKRYNESSQLSNKVMLEQAIDKNADLKRLISRLNEEIQILKREKQCLAQQSRIKAENLQTQKLIAKMNEESNEKLNGIILKMGQKIMNLEYLNQTLRNQLAKTQEVDESTDEHYYRTTKSKVGQFYYKK